MREGGESAPVQGDMDTIITQLADELLELVPRTRPVRVVDLGPGTTRPVRGLLRRLIDESRLEGYRGIDISAELLELARKNLAADFPGQADGFDLRRGDFTGTELAQVLSAAADSGDAPARYVILAGVTLFNFVDPVAVLRNVSEGVRAGTC